MIRKVLLVVAVAVCFFALTSDAVRLDSILAKQARCGKANGGKTCDQVGQKGQCCSGVGYCGTTSYHCNADKGCQSGPCKKTEASDGDKPQEVSSDESDETKVIVKVISNPVPLCKDCKDAEAKKAEAGGEEGSEGSEGSEESSEDAEEQEQEKEAQQAAKTETEVANAKAEVEAAENTEAAKAGEADDAAAAEEGAEESEATSEEAEDAAEAQKEDEELISEETEESTVDEGAEEESAKAEADKDDAAAAEAAAGGEGSGKKGCGAGCVDASVGIAAIKRITAEGEKKAKQIIAAATKAAAKHATSGGKKMVVVDVPGQNRAKAGGDLIVPVSQRKLENVMDPNGY